VKRTIAAGLGVALGLLICAGPAFSQTDRLTDKVDGAVRDAIRAGARTQNVIISVKPGYLATMRRALEDHGDLVKADHESIGALSAEVHAGDINELARQPWVEGVSLDDDVFAIGDAIKSKKPRTAASNARSGTTTSPLPDTHLRESLGLSAAAASGTPTGEGIVWALLDTGIETSQDLAASRVTAFYDVTRRGCARAPRRCATTPFDDSGHGTHIAGLIGSSGILSNYLYQGIAPKVKFVVVKVLDAQGAGKVSDVIAAIEFIVKNRIRLNVSGINLSLGHAVGRFAVLDPLVRAVEQASTAGLIVVVAAGNSARGSENTYGGITSPANAPSALTAGAVDTKWTALHGNDVVADYSARGPTWLDGYGKPDFVSPSSHLISDSSESSTLFKDPLLAAGRIYVNGNPFLQLSGTSMGAGVTSGVVALILEASRHGSDPALTPNAVKAILQYTAIPVTTKNPDLLTQGAGEINAAGAVALASQLNSTVPLGSWWLSNAVVEQTRFGNPEGACDPGTCEVKSWFRNIIWGSDVLGGDLVKNNLLIWSRNILWGTRIAWDDDRYILQGTSRNILWGTRRSNFQSGGRHIRWGAGRNILLGSGRNTLWGTDRNILWGTRIVEGMPVLFVVSGDQASVNTLLWGNPIGPVVVDENIVWSTGAVWGNALAAGRVVGKRQGESVTWGTDAQSRDFIWGAGLSDGDNILWGTFDGDNILWGTWDGDNILWGTWDGDNILWGTTAFDGDNILWGTWDGDNILWGTADGDNILWGTLDGDNILWGTFRRGGGF
jgi:serine protease AprX